MEQWWVQVLACEQILFFWAILWEVTLEKHAKGDVGTRWKYGELTRGRLSRISKSGWPDSWIQSRTSISSLNYKWYLTSVVLLWTCLNNWLLVRFLALKPRIIASRSSWVQHMSVKRVITTDRMRKFNFWEHRYKIAPHIRILTIL